MVGWNNNYDNNQKNWELGIRETKWWAPHLKFVSCVAKGMGTKLVKHQKSKRSDVNIEFEKGSQTQFEVKLSS